MKTINLIQKEAKTLKFTIKDSTGSIVNVSNATFTFYIKKNYNSNPILTKEDSNFDKTDSINGIIKISLSSSDLDLAGDYVGLLETTFSSNNIDKYYFNLTFTPSKE